MLGNTLWVGLAPILAAAVASGITWFVQKESAWVGTFKGYAAQVAAVVGPALIQWATSATGFDFSTAETLAASLVAWIGVHLGVKAASVNPAARTR
jgi:hypothetical protein